MLENSKMSCTLQKHAQENHLLFVNKALSKGIRRRNRLKSKFLKDKTDRNKREYFKQRNNGASLKRKSKMLHHSNLD